MNLEIVEATRKALFKHKLLQNAEKVCAYYAVGYDPKSLKKGQDSVVVTSNTACHGQLQQMGGYHDRYSYNSGAECVVQYIRGGEYSGVLDSVVEKEHIIKYMDWLFNRSPYTQAFFTKDAAKAYEDKYCVLTTEVNGDYLVAALVSLRRVWEYNYICRSWCELVDRGVEENGAFVIAHLAKWVDKNTLTWSNHSRGHISLNAEYCATFINFRSAKDVWGKRTYKEEGTYSTYEKRYANGPRRDDPMLSTFNSCIAKIPKQGGDQVKEQVYINPFQKAFDKAYGVKPVRPKKEDVKAIKEAFDEAALAYPILLEELNCA